MKLFLSSMHFGTVPQELLKLIGQNKSAGIILNANDDLGSNGRIKYFTETLERLARLGISSEELDLRQYFGKQKDLQHRISNFGLLWATGGNTFVLRRAFRESGLDKLLAERLNDSDFVYGGFSAGACIVTPSLSGIELADDPFILPEGYTSEAIWEGLNLVDFHIAPHFRSSPPRFEVIDDIISRFISLDLPHHAIADGEVIVVDGNRIEFLGRKADF